MQLCTKNTLWPQQLTGKRRRYFEYERKYNTIYLEKNLVITLYIIFKTCRAPHHRFFGYVPTPSKYFIRDYIQIDRISFESCAPIYYYYIQYLRGTIQREVRKTKNFPFLKWETKGKLSSGGFCISKAYWDHHISKKFQNFILFYSPAGLCYLSF